MPTLNWIGKEAVVDHHLRVPTRLLVCDRELSVGDPEAENLLVEGDNLEALKALLPRYRGQVKCIYIDPPYNTGNESWVYNDNVNDPRIRKWLGEVVGKEAEDLCRHDKWLCMMYPRLLLLREFLRDDGFILVQIDDAEASHLKLLLDEVFGAPNYLTTIYIQVRYADKTLKQDMVFHKQIEQVLAYRRSPKAVPNLEQTEYDFEKFIWGIDERANGHEVEIGGKRAIIFRKGEYQINKASPSVDALKEIWASGAVLDGNSSGRFFRDHLANRVQVDGLGTLYKIYDIGDDDFDFRYFTGPKKAGATRGKYYQGVPTQVTSGQRTSKKLPIQNYLDLAAEFGNCRHEGGVDFKSGKKPQRPTKAIANYFLGC